jgi:hypothetical protein
MSVPYLGKRNPGGLTAANPGDTLFFPFAGFNDSGDSEAVSGFAVTDIEVFKNGLPTARATDSGYSLISDTGQMGDRVGLNRFSVQIFNTTDDTGFYDASSWYQVAVDAVTIDGKTVRFWAGQFEIDTPRANVVALDGDTGFADRLGKFASLLTTAGLLNAANVSEPLAADVQELDGDTGAATHLQQAFAATNALPTALDTGQVNRAVWNADASRALTAFAFDTGIWGSNFAGGRTLTSFIFDTGVAHTVWASASRTLTAFAFDTGIWGSNFASGRTLTAFQFDTGIWASPSRTLTAISDTGLNERLDAIETKTGSLTFTVAGVVDSNIQRVNDVAIQGTGDTGTADTWRPV